ncbi:hypothetical protein NE865_04371 [Phthorimaea operculella]|nr:hypothetical protein NE865_04371 [Phthorimaea operculella]
MLSLTGFAPVKVLPLLLYQPQKRPYSQKKPKELVCKAKPAIEHRPPLICSLSQHYHRPDPKPCFDISSVLIEQARPCHAKMIQAFLNTHYWPREPSTVGVYMPLNSPYLAVLTEKYSTSGDRWIAYERLQRTNEKKPVGLLVANQTFPWEADEYEKWGSTCCRKPERNHMYFRAHCLRHSKVFDHASHAYEIQALATLPEVSGQGVALLLVRAAILQAIDQRYPFVMIFSKSQYSHKVCERAGMKRTWDMNYTEFVDLTEAPLFFPRKPHTKVALYLKKFDSHIDPVPERWKNPELFAVYKKICLDKETVTGDKKRCDLEYPVFPKRK